jgi:hypothetical protein
MALADRLGRFRGFHDLEERPEGVVAGCEGVVEQFAVEAGPVTAGFVPDPAAVAFPGPREDAVPRGFPRLTEAAETAFPLAGREFAHGRVLVTCQSQNVPNFARFDVPGEGKTSEQPGCRSE